MPSSFPATPAMRLASAASPVRGARAALAVLSLLGAARADRLPNWMLCGGRSHTEDAIEVDARKVVNVGASFKKVGKEEKEEVHADAPPEELVGSRTPSEQLPKDGNHQRIEHIYASPSHSSYQPRYTSLSYASTGDHTHAHWTHLASGGQGRLVSTRRFVRRDGQLIPIDDDIPLEDKEE